MRRTRVPRKAALPGVVLGALVAGAALANTGLLNGDELRQTVAGKRIYLAVPLGGEFPLFYRADGRVDGSGESVGLGRFLKPTDSGRWWIQGNRLCQRWTSWYNGKVFCFTVKPAGQGKIAWSRDDGYSGVARIGD
jgi:hypothetical protein